VEKPPSEASSFWRGAGIVLAVLVGLFLLGQAASSKKSSHRPSHPSPVAAQPAASTDAPATAPPAHGDRVLRPGVARINVSAADGTAALQALAARLSPAEIQALALGVLLTGVDTYGIKVRISNTGTVPIRVFPGNLRVHFGDETVGVTTVNHPLFLQPGVVQPGYYVEGVVMYRAAVDVGAVIRLLGTSFSYDDPSIEVTYGR
jgi:hypothetical protein